MKTENSKSSQTLNLLWMAFLLAFFMHGYLVLSGLLEPINSMSNIPSLLWPIIGGITSIGGFFIYRSIYSGKIDELVRHTDQDSGQNKTVQFFVPHLIAWVVNESASICGLLCFMTSGDLSLALSIIAVSLIVHLCMRPKLDLWSSRTQSNR